MAQHSVGAKVEDQLEVSVREKSPCEACEQIHPGERCRYLFPVLSSKNLRLRRDFVMAVGEALKADPLLKKGADKLEMQGKVLDLPPG